MIGTVLSVIVLTILFVVVYFAILSWSATRPTNLGKQPDGALARCSNKPNCVSTFATDKEHQIAPLTFTGDPTDAWAKLKDAIAATPSARIISSTDDYMHVEFVSKLFRFVDDVEFLLEPDAKTIQFRSASRVGYSDLGINRKRMEDIRDRYEKLSP